ncbi:hypothetical protein M2103_002660 [Ereboglobus sp. PH5-5]|nr:hypothetical protein [Ereboglobus sp. PH5-5]
MTRLLLSLVMVISLTGCATQNVSTRTGAKHGAYYFLYEGHKNILSLGVDARFHYRYSAPAKQDSAPYSYERSGRYVIEGTELWLEEELPDGTFCRAEQPMWIVWWGERCYLVQPWRRTEFIVSAITHRWPKDRGGRRLPVDLREPRETKEGWMYLHEGDWLLPVAGKPIVPSGKAPKQVSTPTSETVAAHLCGR